MPPQSHPALAKSSSSPPPDIDGIFYQCHKATLVPKFHLSLYVRVGVLWGLGVLQHGHDDGRKNKGAIRVPASGLYPLDFRRWSLQKLAPYAAL